MPVSSFELWKGSVIPGPIREALMWEKPLSSPHVSEWRERIVSGISVLSSSFISSTNAGSNSMVVIEAVEPIAVTETMPFAACELWIVSST